MTCTKCPPMEDVPVERTISLVRLFIAGNRSLRCPAVVRVATTGRLAGKLM